MVTQVSKRIIEKALAWGADLAGWASVSDLKKSPSVRFAPKMPYKRDDSGKASYRMNPKLDLKHGEVSWPEGAKSVLVIAVSHPEEKPELDWWVGRVNPPGNRVLMSIIDRLCTWIEDEFRYKTGHLPYQVGQGGLYLKDVAVLAGLGCIGENNLLITPRFGPRVRLRALTVNRDMPVTGPLDFFPCAGCRKPCRTACPQSAMNRKIYDPADYGGMTTLPGRTGFYNVAACDQEMQNNIKEAEPQTIDGEEGAARIIKYCRKCEFACPIGA